MTVEGHEASHPKCSIVVDGKKFLWDGRVFESLEDTLREAELYKQNNFEVHLLPQGETHLVYTRRVVREVVIAAP